MENQTVQIQKTQEKTKRYFWSILGFFLIILVGFISVRAILNSTKELGKSSDAINPSAMFKVEKINLEESIQPKVTVPQVYKLGDEINLGDRIIIIHKFSSYSHKFMNEFYGVNKGVVMEVELRNNSNKEFNYNPLNFEVKNDKGMKFIFYDVIPGGKEPVLQFGSLLPQETIRAFISYVTDDEPYTISYKSSRGPKFFIHLK